MEPYRIVRDVPEAYPPTRNAWVWWDGQLRSVHLRVWSDERQWYMFCVRAEVPILRHE